MSKPAAGTLLFPTAGAYVAFSIDAEMTLEALHDEHVAEVTKNMQTKYFVGYVAKADRIINHESEFQSFRVEILREGFPPRSEKEGIEADMCTPVWPTTEHPSSRAPLRTNNPLPWNNCYHSSFDSIIVRVPTAYEDAEGAVMLLPSEISRHETIIESDRQRAYATFKSRQPIPPVEETSASDGQISPRNRSQESLQNELLPDDDRDSAKSAQEFAQAIVNMAEMDRPPETMITVEMTYDLTGSYVQTLTDPQEFYIEKKALEKLEQDTKTAAIERARRLDEEAFGGAPTQSSAPQAIAPKAVNATPVPWLTRTRQRIASILDSILARFRRSKPFASHATPPS
ncbi:hypothetical protein FIBSPDRAFT_1045297 [Athelia psychrophila]|uniref:Uncharacterized protein n=1 Tax=Athelia psychrophila TaxID=1759441 RepID=A0A166ID16_9AGAM|nr:hypothetical protein FIBSPDRAFT_1045297 [Fibularhizoctonia sp. CBS 109695]